MRESSDLRVDDTSDTVLSQDEDFSSLPVVDLSDNVSPLPSPTVTEALYTKTAEGEEIITNLQSSITSEDIFSFRESFLSSSSSSSSCSLTSSSPPLTYSPPSNSCSESNVSLLLTESEHDLKLLATSEEQTFRPRNERNDGNIIISTPTVSASVSASVSVSASAASTSVAASQTSHTNEHGLSATSTTECTLTNISTNEDISKNLNTSLDSIGKETVDSGTARSNSFSQSSSICHETRHWIDTNKHTCDIALLLFDAFEIETLDYLLEIDALLPPDIVRVFICTKFSQLNNTHMAASSVASGALPDVAYSKCVDYIREKGLPQVEQLFSLDESTINNLQRSIHDTYQRATLSKSRVLSNNPTSSLTLNSPPGQSSTTGLNASSASGIAPTRRALFPPDNDDEHGDDPLSSTKSNTKETNITSLFTTSFSFSKLFCFCDSVVGSYFPSYKIYLPPLLLVPTVLLGLLALYRRSSPQVVAINDHGASTKAS